MAGGELPAIVNLQMQQGQEFVCTFEWVDDDGDAQEAYLTDATVELRARRNKSDKTLLIDWSVSGGQITLTPASGYIDISVSGTVTGALNFDTAEYILTVQPFGLNEIRLVQGVIELSKDI